MLPSPLSLSKSIYYKLTPFLLAVLLACHHASAAVPKVVASIQPIADITAAVMGDLGQPTVLVPPNQSPHTYQLRPSQARSLMQADLVIWIGPHVEAFLPHLLNALPASSQQIALLETPGLHLLPRRGNLMWQEKSAQHLPIVHASDHEGSWDPHIWLDPENAMRMAEQLAFTLSKLDPPHQNQYHQNLVAWEKKVRQMQTHLKQQLHPIAHIPYLVFHDAYHYFEQDFGLHPVGAISRHHGHSLSAKHLQLLGDLITRQHIGCVFKEPQMSDQLVNVLAQHYPLHVGQLDPIGNATQPSGAHYLQLLQHLGDSLGSCLNT